MAHPLPLLSSLTMVTRSCLACRPRRRLWLAIKQAKDLQAQAPAVGVFAAGGPPAMAVTSAATSTPTVTLAAPAAAGLEFGKISKEVER